MCFSPQRRAIFRHRNFKKCSEDHRFLTCSLPNVLFATAAYNFLDRRTSKSAPKLTCFVHFHFPMCFSLQPRTIFRHRNFKKCSETETCFVHFHFPMCFSPHRRTIFRHLNFKKCSETDVFCTLSLQNVLFATAACNFSTSELRKVLRDRQFFSIFTSKCAFRHSGVQFLMSPLSTYLRTRRFNRPTFRLTRHTNH